MENIRIDGRRNPDGVQKMRALKALPRSDGRPSAGAARSDVMVAIPAFNEERFIGSLVIEARLEGMSVLVIDDGSIDRTAEVAEAAGATVARHGDNRGKAEALNTAFRQARANGAAALVVLDGDGQHKISEIDTVVRPILEGEADIVVGSRFLATSPGKIPGVRKVGQRTMTAVTNVGSGVAVTDSQSGFRAFSRRAIEILLFGAKGFSVEAEMQFWAREHGLRVAEVPISAVYTEPPKRNVFSHGLQVLNGVLKLVGRYRPLLFFAVPGLFILLAGLAMGGVVTAIYQNTRVLAVGYSLIAVLLIITGLLGLFAGILLHVLRGSFLDLERRLIDVSDRANGRGHYAE